MNSNLNSVIIEGIITKCEKVEKASYFTVCTNRYFKDMNSEVHEEQSFFNVETYGKLAESCDNILTEGAGVRVVGRLKSINYEDFKVVVHAEHIEAKPLTIKKNKGE